MSAGQLQSHDICRHELARSLAQAFPAEAEIPSAMRAALERIDAVWPAPRSARPAVQDWPSGDWPAHAGAAFAAYRMALAL